jgi:site-specific DNA recombinase
LKAAIYIRVSTPGQAINGESLDMQKDRLLEYVKNQKWELFKTYEDGGFSGKDTNRPAFQQMMRDAALKKFDVLVVYKIDRLSRSVLDFHTTMKSLEKYGISFVSITQQFDTTNSMGRLMLAILVDFANFEREINVDRAIDSYLKRLQDGVNSGAIPFGYRREEKDVVIVPEEAEQVKKMFLLSSQGLSMNQIAKQMGFSGDHVRSVLRNPFYCGYLARKRDKFDHRIKEGSWEWFKGKQEPIIPEELWRRVADLRKRKIKNVVKKSTSLFGHLIYCPYCEHNLCFHSRTQKKRVVYYYQCDPVKIGGPACSQYVREEPLVVLLLKFLDKGYQFHISAPRRDIDIEDKVASLDRRINKILRLVSEELMPYEQGKAQIERLKEQKAALLASRIIELDYSSISDRLKQIRPLYSFMTREEQSRFWHILIDKIEARHDKLVVYWRFGKKHFIRRSALPDVLKKECAFTTDDAPRRHHKNERKFPACRFRATSKPSKFI